MSRVLGDGLATLLGSRQTDKATDMVHKLMLLGLSAGTSSKDNRSSAVAYGGMAFVALWAAGQSRTAITRYGERSANF